MSTKPSELLAVRMSPDGDPIAELLHEAERRLAANKTPVITRERLEYRVKSFTQYPGVDYAKHAVAYLWSIDPAAIADIKSIPAQLFANAKQMVVFAHDSRRPLYTDRITLLDSIFDDAIGEAILDALYVADNRNTGDVHVDYEEVPYFGFFRNQTDQSLLKLPATARVSYALANNEKGRAYHKIESIQGFSSQDLERAFGHGLEARLSAANITLRDCCAFLQNVIQCMRDESSYGRADSNGKKYRLFRKRASSPFMTDIGAFLFAKAAGRPIDTFMSAEPKDTSTVICEIIDAIIAKQDPTLTELDKTTDDGIRKAAATNTIIERFPDTNRFPRLHTQLTQQIWATIFRLGRNPSPGQAGPTIEEEFVVALAGKLDISDLEGVCRAWQEASVSRWNPFSKKKTKAEIEKEKLGTGPQGKGIEDLYNAQLMIYKLYRAGLVKASSTNEHIAHQGRLMIACAEIWAERLENVLVALEVDMVTSSANPEETIRQIQSLAETVLNPGRDVVREILAETRLQLEARAEVEEALK